MSKFAENTWTFEQDLKFVGLEIGARMTIVDLGGGKLFVHSPIRLTETLKSEIRKLGQVTYVVAPNRVHHLFIADFKAEFPEAKFYCAPGLQTKRKDFWFDGIISDEQKFPWNPVLQHLCVKGAPFYNEVVFFDSRSKTLIVTDLAVHIHKSKSLVTQVVFKAMSTIGRFGWNPIEKFLFIWNKKAFYKSIDGILQWDFERVILAHGESVTANGRQMFKEAFKH